MKNVSNFKHYLSKSCLLSIMLAASLSSYSQITLNVNGGSVKSVIHQIEAQSEYRFFYDNNLTGLSKKVNINVKDQSIDNVLNEICNQAGISYTIKSDKQVVIHSNKVDAVQQFAPKKISGVVSDEQGMPIIGANIMVKGTTIGTITDIDGKFVLDVDSDVSILEVSYIGYKTQNISFKGKKELAIVLKEDTETLDEVVVVGYGTTSAKKMVSAVTSVKGDKLQNLPFANVASTLQGRASGVVIQNQGGEPGSNPKISIRGGGDPLYVIDGVICSSWDFQTLNTNDIESLSVLKDAASLAVYGSRAADGIILVKTKEGKKGKKSITYSFNAQYSKPTVLPDKIDSYTYASIQNDAALNDGLGEYSQFSKEELDIIKNQTDPIKYPNTDWYDLGLKKFAPEYRHTLALNGNQKDVNYYLSLGIFDQGSLYKSDALKYSRYNLRSNINNEFKEIGLKVALNINAAYEKKMYPSFSSQSIWEHLQARNPLSLAFNSDGTLSSVGDNPLMEMDKRSGYNKNDGMFMNLQFLADWTIPRVKGLSLGTMFNYRLNSTHVKTFSARAPQYNQDGTLWDVEKPSLREEAIFGDNYNFELSAGYVNTFLDKHSIDLKFVFTASEDNGSNFWAARRDYLSTNVDQLFAGSSTSMTNSGNATEGGRMGLVGILKYNYGNRYYIEGSFRYDGSDNFAPGYRWGFFPSIALAWDITEEDFIKNFSFDNLNLLKFRGSYGQMGTETGVNRFGYLSTYNMVENAICIGGNLLPGFNEGKLVLPDQLSWYTRTSLDYGLDIALFNHRLKGSVDYFFYVTKGGLVSPVDRYTTPLGTSLPQIKSDNEHRREGFELSLNWSDETPFQFYYSIGTNMVYYNNLYVKNQGESSSITMNPWKRGTHQTDYYDVVYLDRGLYQTPEQILEYPRRLASTETMMGDIAYKDINGDGKIDTEDQVRFGMPTTPHFTYGIDFNLSYKGFSVSGLLYGTGRRNMEFFADVKGGEAIHVINEYQTDYWRENNKESLFPRISSSARVNGGNNIEKSSFWIKNASFLRLKNLSLEYDFKYKLLKNTNWIKMCKLNLSGTNLFTISDVMDYWDPESASTSGSYPVQRVYSLGIILGF